MENLVQITDSENNKTEPNFAIGIDLGTTYSLCAVYDLRKDESIKLIPLSPESTNPYLLPSAVTFTGKSTFIVGESALKLKSACKSTKKNISKIFSNKNSNDKNLGVESLACAEAILKFIKEQAEKYCGESIKYATITVPANFDDGGRNATKIAAEKAGISVLRIINEPTAAALLVDFEESKKLNSSVLVYDLGGGTFDCSIVKARGLDNRVYKTIASAGDTFGGDDIDVIIMDLIAYKMDISSLTEAKRVGSDLKNLANSVKLALSDKLSFTLENGAIITRKELEKAITPLIMKTISLVKKTLFKGSTDVDKIVLIGGSSRIPLIEKLLKKNCSIPIYKNTDPDLAVAKGACVQSINIMKNNSSLLIDITPLTIGLETFSGLKEPLIPRNTPLPFKGSCLFTTQVDNQNAISFHIVQGESEWVKDCFSIAKFELDELSPKSAGSHKIILEYRVDCDGILHLTAASENKTIDINIYTKFQELSPFEIEVHLQQAEKSAQIDTAQKLIHTHRHKILMKLNHLHQVASNDKISKKEIETMLETSLTNLNIFELHSYLKKLINLNNEIDKMLSESQSDEIINKLIGKKLT